MEDPEHQPLAKYSCAPYNIGNWYFQRCQLLSLCFKESQIYDPINKPDKVDLSWYRQVPKCWGPATLKVCHRCLGAWLPLEVFESAHTNSACKQLDTSSIMKHAGIVAELNPIFCGQSQIAIKSTESNTVHVVFQWLVGYPAWTGMQSETALGAEHTNSDSEITCFRLLSVVELMNITMKIVEGHF